MARSLNQARIDARWVLPQAQQYRELRAGEVVMEMTTSAIQPAPESITRIFGAGITLELTRTLQMQRSELDRHLIELLDQATWIEGVRYLLTDFQLGDGRPWPHYRDEEQAWS